MAIRYYADIERVTGEPHPHDPGSTHWDLNVPRHAAYENRAKAEKAIVASLKARTGDEWKVTKLTSTFLSRGRR